jgi:hypothetical protein
MTQKVKKVSSSTRFWPKSSECVRNANTHAHLLYGIPGMTMSPRPSIENWYSDAKMFLGKINLIGASKDFATETITSVPNTQKIS